VPASIRDGAGMRRHLRLSAACGARVGAAESFVSFIPLFGGVVRPTSKPIWPQRRGSFAINWGCYSSRLA
jgi:hypothetical protein